MISKILAFLFGGVVSTTPATHTPASIDELLTYECARQIVDLIPLQNQSGPVFFREGVLISSVSTVRGEKLLIVNSGSGTYAVPLFGLGVNRLRLKLPGVGDEKILYASYTHGGSRDSRLFEFSVGRAPAGKDEMDYQDSPVRRAEDLLGHFEFNVFETIEHILTQITAKKIPRHELGLVKVNACDHIGRRSPALARTIRYDLDMVAAVLNGGTRSNRMPASVTSAQLLGK